MKTSKKVFNSKSEIITATNFSSSFNNKLSIIFIVFQTILLGSILSTTNVDILLSVMPFSKISFSGLDVQIPFMVIYVLLPIALLIIHFFLLLNFTMHFKKISNSSINVNFTYPFFLNFFNSNQINSTKKTFYGLIVYFLFFWMPLCVFLLILVIISKYQSNLLFTFHITFLLADFFIVDFYTKTVSNNLKFRGFYRVFHFTILFVAILHFTVYISIVNEKLPVSAVHNKCYSFALPILTIENEVFSMESPLAKLMADERILYSSGYLNLKNRSFKYSNFKNLSFYKADFRNSGFSKSILSELTFTDCNLQHSNIRDAIFDKTKFIRSDLRNTNVQKAIFVAPVDFSGSNIESCNFTEKNLSNSDFSETSAEAAIFAGSKLNNARFTKAKLNNSNFIASEAQWADFSCANLKFASFTGAALDHSTFEGADLYRTEFYAADFYKGNLSYTDLRYTLLQGAFLSDAIFNGSILQDMVYEHLDEFSKNAYQYFKNQRYSFFNLRGTFLERSTGNILIVKIANGHSNLFHEKIFYIDSSWCFGFCDSVAQSFIFHIESIDTTQIAESLDLVGNFRQRMVAAKARFDTDPAMKYCLPKSIQAIKGSTQLGKYLKILEQGMATKPDVINCLIDNYTKFANDRISNELINFRK